MRIGIDLHPHREGGGRYIFNLAQALARTARQHEVHAYFEPSDTLPPLPEGRKIHLHPMSCDSQTAWEQTQAKLPRQLAKDGIQVFHCHFHRLPVAVPCKTVVTIHDAIPLLAAERTVPPHRRRTSREQLLAAIRLADHIIVSSLYTATQLTGKLKISPKRLTYIHLGFSKDFYPLPKREAAWRARKLFGVKKPFFLSVGTLIPRKNYPLLIRAFRKELWKTHDLVIVGTLSWWGKRVLQLIKNDPSIHYVGPVPDKDLLYLYGAARCFVYPSELEGFGLPLLEAMACGTPVVAAHSSSIPEVVGNAGLLVETGSVSRLAHAMQRIVEDKDLSQMLRHRGLKRVLQFRWEETARKTLKVYRKVLSGNSYQGI